MIKLESCLLFSGLNAKKYSVNADSKQHRFLGRTIGDVTSVTAEELRSPVTLVPPVRESGGGQPAHCHVIAVASGKGGTGKTVVTTNLATLLAREGFRVILLDADLGLANAHVLLGVYPDGDISSVLSGQRNLSDIMTECEPGLHLISGGSGFSELAELSDWRLRFFSDQLKECEKNADIMLLDLSAGISPQVIRFLNASHEIMLVTTPDATALLDAYATVKVLSKQGRELSVKLVINRCQNRDEAIDSFKKINTLKIRKNLPIDLQFMDWLPSHWSVRNSVVRRSPAVLIHSRGAFSRKLGELSQKVSAIHLDWKARRDTLLNSGFEYDRINGGFKSFASQLGSMVYS